jgi:murein DD-endopeptidase MepM/ murein hydrolase activator NlpD
MIRYQTILALVFLMMGTQAGLAIEIWKGEAVQGGMVILKTEPDAIVTWDDTPVMVAENGLFVIGFHRDDTSPITLIATLMNGEVKRLVLTPDIRNFEEQRIDGLPPAMVTPPQEVLDRIARDREVVANARAVITTIEAWQDDFIWPAKGIITGVYGSRRILNGQPRAPHYGIDIAAAAGSPVVAPADGIIRMVDDLYYTGITIILDHGHGVSSTFLHLQDAAVTPDMVISKGDVIGHVGSTGRSTGPHLDWRVNWRDKRLDPELLAGPMPD